MSRLAKPLTNTEIERAKPKEKDYKLTDGQGLFLLVKITGSKLWRFNYYKPLTNPPKRTETSLGKYPEISLAQARKQRDEFLALLAKNIDPQIHRQAIIDEEIFKRENTLRLVAEKWREKKGLEVQPKTMEKNWARLENHLFSKLGDVAISAITPQMVIKTVEPLKERGISDTFI
ncbi:phage integrase family site-specific recombinase [[Pasteurella] mairii]|uniref:Phage integrase family site-specific recombinase n=1 Tax=[Pasteurella] mairii TaxID=757 RepID=A0A379B6Z6_9PAST|nr:phage integrase family site-specific recombinase [[Pasteurella] mairii]